MDEDGSSNDRRTPPGEPGLVARLIDGMQHIPPTLAMNTNIAAIMAMHATGKIHQIIGQCIAYLLQGRSS